MTAFNKKKEEARAHMDMAACETSLKQLGIENIFEFADHAKIYNAFTALQSKWSAFLPGTLLFPPLIIIRVVRFIVPPSPTELLWRLCDEECARAKDMRRPEQHFHRVRADELAQAGRRNDGLRLRRAKAVLASALRRRK